MPSIVIAQGGGPTAVINQTLAGAIGAAQRLDPSLRILGARHGVRGLVARDVADLTDLSEGDLVRLGNTPSAALGSTRDKPDAKACEAIFAALEALDARAFIYIGGNDTAGTLELLRSQSSRPVLLRARAQDHRQRPHGERPRARLHFGRHLRGPCHRQRRSRCPGSPRHLCRHRDGTPRRLSHRVARCLAGRPGRRAASHLRAREALQRRPVSRRHRGGPRSSRALHRVDVRRGAGRDRPAAWPRRCRWRPAASPSATPMATCN